MEKTEPDHQAIRPYRGSGRRFGTWQSGLLATACAWSFLVVGCAAEPPTEPSLNRDRDVLVFLIDALRADRLGCSGSPHDVSPNIDSLAAEGIRFENAISSSTFTGTSVASLFTGLHPHHHGLYWGSLIEGDDVEAHILPSSLPTLAERMQSHGYRTASWFQNRMLRSELGFGRGFDIYEEIRGNKYRGGRRIVDRYLDWLSTFDDDRASFAYLHVLDLHDPYDPPQPFNTLFLDDENSTPAYDPSKRNGGRSWFYEVRSGERKVTPSELEWVSARYDGALNLVDQQLGRLVDGLKQLGRYDNTLIVITADHGDCFLEHGSLGHSNLPYIEVVHVPLIFKLPESSLAGSVIPDQVRLVDVMPTLVEMVGGPGTLAPDETDGCSLLPLLAPGDDDPRPRTCTEAVSEFLIGGRQLAVAVRQPDTTYLWAEGLHPSLFDRRDDPDELVDLAGRGIPAETRLHERAIEIAAAARSLQTERIPVDSEVVEQIRALGYIDD